MPAISCFPVHSSSKEMLLLLHEKSQNFDENGPVQRKSSHLKTQTNRPDGGATPTVKSLKV